MKIYLLADIGGTNIRFGLYQNGQLLEISSLKCDKFQSIYGAIDTFLRTIPVYPTDMIIGAAGNVVNQSVQLTNRPWLLVAESIKLKYNFNSCLIVNDFVIQGLGVLSLQAREKLQIGSGKSQDHEPICVLGPGTGLGVCFLTEQQNGWVAHPSEGGHTTVPTSSKNEQRIVALLGRRYGLVSAERLISGQGLVNIYDAVRILEEKQKVAHEKEKLLKSYQKKGWHGKLTYLKHKLFYQGTSEREKNLLKSSPYLETPREIVRSWKEDTSAVKQAFSVKNTQRNSLPASQLKPEDITALAEKGDKLALLSYWYFFNFLGLFASNMALTLKTTGGVYLVGGILIRPSVLKLLKHSNFRRSFENKGRFTEYLKNIPTYLVTRDDLPFLGLSYLAEHGNAETNDYSNQGTVQVSKTDNESIYQAPEKQSISEQYENEECSTEDFLKMVKKALEEELK